MKILITHELFPPDCPGGGEVIIFELAKGLKKRGHDIKVLTTGNPKIREFEGVPTTRLPIHRYLMNLTPPWIYRQARDVDLIQTNNYNACLPSFIAGKLLNKPVICINTGLSNPVWTELRGPIWGNISKQVERLQLCRGYDRIVFYSEFARDLGLKMGIPEEICEIISPGVETEKFDKEEIKEPFVLFVGRDLKRKGIDYLLEAARKLPNVIFRIAGAGADEEHVKALAPPQNVEFLGFITGEPLYDLYRRALIFCLPSLNETFGLVILEAMAAGCAVVSTIPLDYEGIRIEPSDSTSLQEAIDYLVQNRELALKAGKANREKAKQHTWEDYAERFEGLYDTVLASRRNREKEDK